MPSRRERLRAGLAVGAGTALGLPRTGVAQPAGTWLSKGRIHLTRGVELPLHGAPLAPPSTIA